MTPGETKARIVELYFGPTQRSIRELVKDLNLPIWTVYQTLLHSGRPLRKPSKRKRYTQACERKIVHNYEKHGPIKAAKLAGFSVPHVYTVLARHKHPTKLKTRSQREQQLLAALINAYDLKELTIEQQIPWEKVYRVAKKHNIPFHRTTSSGPKRVEQVLRLLQNNHHPWLVALLTNLTTDQVNALRTHFNQPPPPKMFFRVIAAHPKASQRTTRLKRG